VPFQNKIGGRGQYFWRRLLVLKLSKEFLSAHTLSHWKFRDVLELYLLNHLLQLDDGGAPDPYDFSPLLV
jgi:hypothetical protein